MSNPYLPPETLDYIVDLLHGRPDPLKECCLVSKSWVPRTRKHLFANIEFISIEDLESWKKTFPDPLNSPAWHTHTLFFRCAQVVMAAGAEAGSLIRSFSRVVRLELTASDAKPLVTFGTLAKTSLAPFHKFSHFLKSLRVDSMTLPLSGVFDLVLSFPLLEDLTLMGDDDFPRPQTTVPSTSPPLTGTLELTTLRGMESTTRRLLDLPNGIHFRKLVSWWFYEDDLRWMVELVVRWSDTLECLDVRGYPPSNASSLATIDLSEATRLKDVVFRYTESVDWITMALQTITPKHQDLQQISVHVPSDPTVTGVGATVRQSVGERIFGGWLDLDRLLVQFWESSSIRPRVICRTLKEEEEGVRFHVGCLLPEITKRGIIDLSVEYC